MTHRLVFDHHDDDVHFCAADIGWVTGHSYIVYGPLANGATSVMFESVPTYPDPGRYWQVVDEPRRDPLLHGAHGVARDRARGRPWVEAYDRGSLRVLGSVGEPINPEVWKWYHDVVGDGRCPVVDTWWQTETGGILIAPLPGATPLEPGSATLPFFGVEPVLVDADGNELPGNGQSGNLCLKRSWPGQARTIQGDHQRFVETYFSTYPGMYFTGDGCRRDENGVLLDHGPRRRRAERLRAPARHGRDRERPGGARRGGRGGGRRLPARDQGRPASTPTC